MNPFEKFDRLTDEQKEQAKEAGRSHSYIANTWTLFMMFLSQPDCRDALGALEKAREAMEVWKDFEEANRIDYPDIEPNEIRTEEPFSETFTRTMREMMPQIAEAVTTAKIKAVREQMQLGDSMEEPTIWTGEGLASPPASPTEGGQVE